MGESAGASRWAGRGVWAAAGAVLLGWVGWTVSGRGPTGVNGAAGGVVSVLFLVADALPTVAGVALAAGGFGYAVGLRRFRGGAVAWAAGAAVWMVGQYVLALTAGLNGWAAWGWCAAGWGCGAWALWRRGVVNSRDATRPRGSKGGEDAASRGAKRAGGGVGAGCDLRGGSSTKNEYENENGEGVGEGRGDEEAAGWRGRGWTAGWGWVLWMPGIAMLVVAACCPPGTLWRVEALGYDVLSYHLQVPREWVAAGGMVELEHTVYATLPGLMESAYAGVMAMRGPFSGVAGGVAGGGGGGVQGSVYACQLLHVSLAVLAAWGVAGAVGAAVRGTGTSSGTSSRDATRPRGSGSGAGTGMTSPGLLAAAVLLTVPWVLVTGSSAYNEMAVLAFAAAGWAVVASLCGNTTVTPHQAPPAVPPAGGAAPVGGGGCHALGPAAVVGLLCGAATLSKATAGFTVALPLGALLVWRVWRAEGVKRAAVAGGVCAGVGAAVLLPYLLRNAAWTGNPLFPFATGVFGTGHWDAGLAERWHAAHTLPPGSGEASGITRYVEALWRQVLGNVGYGAVGGHAAPREVHNIARFATEGGFPVLWVGVALAAPLALWVRQTRGHAAALLLWMAAQVLWWLSLTHLQSRFLITLVVPAAGLIGLGLVAASSTRRAAPRWIAHALAASLIVTLALTARTTLRQQTAPLFDPDHPAAPATPAPLWAVVDALPERFGGSGLLPGSPLDALPPGSRTLVVADNSRLFYIAGDFGYASAFDRSPLTPLLDTADARPPAARLRTAGYTHLFVGYGELERLHATYGFDEAVTADRLQHLTRGWPVVYAAGPAVLYRVPPAASTP